MVFLPIGQHQLPQALIFSVIFSRQLGGFAWYLSCSIDPSRGRRHDHLDGRTQTRQTWLHRPMTAYCYSLLPSFTILTSFGVIALAMKNKVVWETKWRITRTNVVVCGWGRNWCWSSDVSRWSVARYFSSFCFVNGAGVKYGPCSVLAEMRKNFTFAANSHSFFRQIGYEALLLLFALRAKWRRKPCCIP